MVLWKGIGYHLLAEAENLLKLKGINEMWLWVLVSNERAIAFYEKHKFKHIGNATFQMETNRYDNKVMLKQL
ncbi:MAG: GNAT family N-acetyltransferase [Bacteroidetes bacterium]|nr:GNAT family N-acetyltransferase [Bacteroidota bacterium]